MAVTVETGGINLDLGEALDPINNGSGAPIFNAVDKERARYSNHHFPRCEGVKLLIFCLIGVLALASCSRGGTAFEFYVVIEPDETAKFIGAITVLAEAEGLETAEGRAVADTGNVSRFVEGRGGGIILWVQNMLLSGNEDPAICGVHPEPYSDPAQFSIFTQPRFLGSRSEATRLGERLYSRLHEAGFDARRKPVVCGVAAL